MFGTDALRSLTKAESLSAEEVVSMPNCEDCWNYNYDEEEDEYYCSKDIDEDEWYRIQTLRKGVCPYFRQVDDYYLPRHQ